jgi:hypothetical protein
LKKTGSEGLAALLSRFLGGVALLAGLGIIVGANMLWGPVSTGFSKFSDGLSAAHDAVDAISSGVGSSSTIVSRVRESIITTSQVVTDTGNLLSEVGYVTDELRDMSLLAIEDLEKLGTGLSALVGQNNFYEMSERLAMIYGISGDGMVQLEQLIATLETLEGNLIEVAAAVETLESDLFSTEAAFGEANTHLARAARAAEAAVSSKAVLYAADAVGLVVILTGFYLMILGGVIRRMSLSPGPPRPPEGS